MKDLLKNKYLVLCIVACVAIIAVVIWGVLHPADDVTQLSTEDDYADIEKLVMDDTGIEATFSGVILSSPAEERKLIVAKQNATISSTLDKKLFSTNIELKSQKVKYTGTGYFCIDLDKITEKDIQVDTTNKVVTIAVNSPRLEILDIDPEKIQVQKTDNSWFSFGELKVTVKDYVILEKTINDKMIKKLKTDENQAQIQQIGKDMVKEVYEPVIKVISSDYTVQVVYK